jgi:hypothetical protein
VDPAPALPFEVVETDRKRIYRLPRREVGQLRLLALLPLGFIVILTVCLAGFYLRRAVLGIPDDWFWAILAVAVPGWAWMVYTGLDMTAAFWCGHSEIEVTRDRVTSYDRAGWFGMCVAWFKRGRGLRLVLEECSPPRERSRSLLNPPFALWQLSAQGTNGKKGWLAIGYPREILVVLAEHLARVLEVTPDAAEPALADNAPPATPTPVAVVAEAEFPNRDILVAPPNTRVTLERHPDGLTLTVPPIGLKGRNIEPFALGAFIATVGVFLAGVSVINFVQNGNWEFAPVLVIATAFIAVGGGLTLYRLNAGRKKVVLAVVGDKFLTCETGPLGSKRREFACADLLDITCRPNDNIPDLLILTRDRTGVVLLDGREKDELRWIATVLRQALGIPSEAPGHRKPDRPPRPWDKPASPGTPTPAETSNTN